MPKVLIVEDETILLDLLARHLESEGYTVVTAVSGDDGLEVARREQPDICVLDVMLPGLDGLSLCRILRRESDVAIILLTARAGEIDRVIGLDNGADDYVVKPFSLSELLARIRARLRPRDQAVAWRLEAGGITLDLRSREATVDDRSTALSTREFALLEVLLRHAGQVLSQAQLLDQVWGYDFDGGSNVVEVYVRHLRTKLGRDRIETVRGAGYRVAKSS